VFNGEIYNFQKLREECLRRGDRFRSDTDTEVILALYRHFGPDCLGLLRGMFAFALWDASGHRLFIARDRAARSPELCHDWGRPGVLFGDPPAVAASRSLENRGPGSIGTLPAASVRSGAVDDLSRYPQAPSAHFAIFDRTGLKLHQYWEVDYTKKCRISEPDALDALEEKLTEAVRLRMIADVPLGALLSGGVDSSLVVALMAKISSAPVRTFSMGFREEAFSELPFAEQARSSAGPIITPPSSRATWNPCCRSLQDTTGSRMPIRPRYRLSWCPATRVSRSPSR